MANILNGMNTLLELAKRNLDNAAERLAKANRDAAQARDQEKHLQNYRGEYIDQRNALSLEGVTATDLQNYMLFLKNLDQAIVSQGSAIHQYDEIVKHHLAYWQKCQAKKRSYEVIIERNQLQMQKLAARREQKQMDEFSSNQRRFLSANNSSA
ncbi:flagellar export protein FliJ [Polynucleobacter sp. UB-Raua-W9]|uniref:flagellar export protein FliJ n=1 Tax=Polynucleobacter sp. UB-Raua-W9 TaxID=1819736 RepID=UPI001BFEDAA6|nr:flagellar export protein FliJ [Polynucleobacter sp. UB-Raua-W9]MBT8575296.1 flagellar export protein FliJ [Polynucleobacter paneuropaeus]QWD71805.1 flagellar export protein FliJ [Polynucleobacter sp. UB-Raua-W9]